MEILVTRYSAQIAAFINEHIYKMPTSMIGRQIARRFPEADANDMKAGMALAAKIREMDADEAIAAALEARRLRHAHDPSHPSQRDRA